MLLETDSPAYDTVRDRIASFAEIVKTPEYVHTYRITSLSLWNAAAAGHGAEAVLETLRTFSRYDVPSNVEARVRETLGRFGLLRIEKGADLGDLYLSSGDPQLLARIVERPEIAVFVTGRRAGGFSIRADRRGHLKQALLEMGYPPVDLAGYASGEFLELSLREQTLDGRPSLLRRYQKDAVQSFLAGGSVQGGSGVVVLPCGAGKTLVGLGAMAQLKSSTLILTPNNTGVRQWIRELLQRTSLTEDQVGEYTGLQKHVRPVTVTTYQILSRPGTSASSPSHFELFFHRPWGLIIYDEVHLLPAPVFRITAELQSVRRLGLTATLVREDRREGEVFALVGPKRYDVPWKEMERQGWIAPAECREVRVDLPTELRLAYVNAAKRDRFHLSATNPVKLDLVRSLAAQHREDRVLVIGQFLDQLKAIAEALGAPLITGATPERRREELYAGFRKGDPRCLVVSKVANFALDLPEANVAVQVSGTFGSRQEEAQRLGRILRPKEGGGRATFYSVVTKNTVDQDFALQRQLFLVEQGYRYSLHDLVASVPSPEPGVGAPPSDLSFP